jgi:hypothetical protein
MTGGIGFSRRAHDNNAQNLKLRKKRIKQEDNPYSPIKPNYKRDDFINFQEIVNYKKDSRLRNKKMNILVKLVVFLIVLLGVIFLMNIL